jgi:hypothetical protein
MKTIYYMAVCKPKESKTWLPMMVEMAKVGRTHILRATAQACKQDAEKRMTEAWIAAESPANRYSSASQWEVAAAAVVIE